VKKISKPKEAENITDLSYSHVNYIKKRIKNKKILDEIRIAKAFCYATNTYGAESYIGGFSGYAIELLVYHYGSFLKFIKAISKLDGKKEIIDI
jgi:tRNA nucleotidyltransferase (CCA-adding enzyme)